MLVARFKQPWRQVCVQPRKYSLSYTRDRISYSMALFTKSVLQFINCSIRSRLYRGSRLVFWFIHQKQRSSQLRLHQNMSPRHHMLRIYIVDILFPLMRHPSICHYHHLAAVHQAYQLQFIERIEGVDVIGIVDMDTQCRRAAKCCGYASNRRDNRT